MKFENSMNELKSRMKRTEERTCEPEDRIIDITKMSNREAQTKEKKKGQSLKNLGNYNKRSSICIIRGPEREKKEYGAENSFKKHSM